MKGWKQKMTTLKKEYERIVHSARPNGTDETDMVIIEAAKSFHATKMERIRKASRVRNSNKRNTQNRAEEYSNRCKTESGNGQKAQETQEQRRTG